MFTSLINWFFGSEPEVPKVDNSAELLYSHNILRKLFNLKPLEIDEHLVEAASEHARWMSDRGRLSHIGRGGSKPNQRARLAGSKSEYISENIAMCPCTVKKVMELWYKSELHRENMLDKNLVKVGFARYGNYWCAVFSD